MQKPAMLGDTFSQKQVSVGLSDNKQSVERLLNAPLTVTSLKQNESLLGLIQPFDTQSQHRDLERELQAEKEENQRLRERIQKLEALNEDY
jgi:hypothetical protein